MPLGAFTLLGNNAMISVDNKHFIDGWTAYLAKLPRMANPYLYLANPHRLWCIGWDAAHLCELASMGIHHLPDDVKPTESGLERLDKSPFAQGQVAFIKGIKRCDYPYDGLSVDGRDWVAGWDWEANKAPKPIYSDFAPERHVVQPVERFAWLAWIVNVFRKR